MLSLPCSERWPYAVVLASDIQAEVPGEGVVGKQFSMVSHISVYLASRGTDYLLFFPRMFEWHATLEDRATASPKPWGGLLKITWKTDMASLQGKRQAYLLAIL